EMVGGAGAIRVARIVVRGQAQIGPGLHPDIVGLAGVVAGRVIVPRGEGSLGEQGVDKGWIGGFDGSPVVVLEYNDEDRIDAREASRGKRELGRGVGG